TTFLFPSGFLSHLHAFGFHQATASLRIEGKLVDAKASYSFFSSLRAERGRWCGAQNHTAAGSDPIPMPVAVQNDGARAVGLDRSQDIRGVDQGQTHTLMQADGGDGILHDLVMQGNNPRGTGRISENRFESAQLGRTDEADGVGERKVSTRVGV